MAGAAEMLLDVHQQIEISAAIGDAYRQLIRRLTTESGTPDGRPMPMVLEEWPGGRWFRDLDTGQGHLWGFVQVIKPPTLLEIHGPMFMSYAVAGHVQFRLTPVAGGVELAVRHRVIGPVEEEHREGVQYGWSHFISDVKRLCE